MPDNSSHNEKELLLKISEGDEKAFTVLFDRHQGKLFSIAIDLTHSAQVAEELVQDVFLKVWLKRNQLTRIDSFAAYIFIILRNEAYDWLSTQSRRKRILQEFFHNQVLLPELPYDLIQKKEFNAIILKGMEQLPEQQREVFKKIRVEGLSREQTAIALDINVNTVKTHLSRALKAIRAWCIVHGDLTIITCWLIFF